MTTNGTPVIVPPMTTTGVSLWTPTGPRIIPGAGVGPHTETHIGTDPSHTDPHPSHTTGDPSPMGTHTEPNTNPEPSHTDPVGTHTNRNTAPVGTAVGTHTAGDTDTGETPDDQEVPPVGTDVGTHVGTHDDDTAKGTPMHLSDTDRTALATLDSKAEQIRYICGTLGNPDTVEVHTRLEAAGIEASRKYVSRIVNDWRKEKGMDDTGAFPTVTDADLAELDYQAHDDERTPDEPADPDDDEEVAAELAKRVRWAKSRLPLQSEEALYEALSDEEMDQERKLAEEEREAVREIRRRRMAADLANAKRDQATAEAVAKSEASDARWLQRARSKKRRLTSPDAKLAQTVRNSEWSSRALIAMVAVGMLWSAVNAQKNLVPSGNMADPLFWLSYGVEAMISIPLIIIMVASASATRMGRVMPTQQKRKVYAVEAALLFTTLALNVGPHLAPPEGQSVNPVDLFKFGIAPVMVGVLLHVHEWASDHYADLIKSAGTAPGVTQSDQQTENAGPIGVQQ